MAKKKAAFTSRAWYLLRLALLWARKGGIFKRSAMLDFLKTIRPASRHSINYERGERELSFDETPMFHFKMHRPISMRFPHLPHIPCINPSVDFDDGDDDDNYHNRINYYREGHSSHLRRSSSSEDEEFDYESRLEDDNGGNDLYREDEGIDCKAEEFIARFYEQMKLQRQVSYLEYNEMLQRSIS